MSSYVTFGGSVVIAGPEDPTEVRMLPMWASQLSQGLARWVYRGTDRYVEHWTLHFQDLTGAEWGALRNFFTNTAQGPTNTFSYEHTDGETYTARFIDTDLTAQRRNNNSFAVRLTLELSGQQVNGTSTSTTTPGP